MGERVAKSHMQTLNQNSESERQKGKETKEDQERTEGEEAKESQEGQKRLGRRVAPPSVGICRIPGC